MATRNIREILKPDASTKAYPINYGSSVKKKEMKELKSMRDKAFKSKDIDWDRLSQFVMKI
jgi:triosephosphate isomerase